jgi:outer membrane protein assembly factor BamE (lipoprotein component of BamABCDE complex)
MRFTILSLIVLLAFTGGCTPVTATRGNMLEDYQVASVSPGVDTKAEVMRKLGSPTTMAPFDDNTWYYLGQRTEKRAVLDPKITEERVYKATFNTAGILQTLEPVNNQREDVSMVSRTTPTGGNDITAVQQLLGNLGRFNKEGMGSDGPVGQ